MAFSRPSARHTDKDIKPVIGHTPDPASAPKATLVEGSVAPAAIGAPEPLAAVETLVQSVVITAVRGDRTNNANTVWRGFSAANQSQKHPMVPTEWRAITAPPGKLLDLNQIYIDVETVGDGVVWEATR